MIHQKENVVIATKELHPHPEAAIPIGEEAKAALRESLEERGLYQPLLVMKRKEGGWWIIDGRNRFEALKAQRPSFPCNVVELDKSETVYDIALECATKGRDRTSGQRILAYMLRNKEAVLEAAEKGKEASQGASLKKGQTMGKWAPAQSRDRAGDFKDFSSKGIAETLGVSDKDTLLGAELLKCHVKRVGVSRTVGGLKEEGRPLEEGDPELVAIDEVWAGVLSGTVPIRRCMAAIGGKKTTKEVQRAAIKWVLVGHDGLVKVKNALGTHWEELSMDERLKLLEEAREVAAELPREVREVFAAGAAKKG